jgi:phosphoserine aminotransferase
VEHPILPDDLRPADGRFGSGPSLIRPAAIGALAAAAPTYLGTSHRREGVRSVVRRIRAGLASLFSLPAGHEVLLGNGGATAFWDAAAFSLVERRSEHLVFGEFSGKFAAVTAGAPFLEDPVIVESAPGTHPEPVADASVDAYALTHNETSTGVMAPVVRPGPGLVLVDGTSAAGAVGVDAADFDAYYFSPQKALGSEGGLWVALCSPAAVDRIERGLRWCPPFLDLGIALSESRRGQTYNTPALATLFLLAEQIEWLLDRGGLAAAAERGERAAAMVYGWAERAAFTTPFVADPAMRSRTVATIDIDDAIPADALTTALRASGIVDIEGYRKLERNQIRIAMFPAVDLGDLQRLCAAVDWMAARVA